MQSPDELHPQGQTRIMATAKILGIHHQTLRKWWKSGKFPKPTSINGMLLFKNSDILEWLELNQSDNPTQKQGG